MKRLKALFRERKDVVEAYDKGRDVLLTDFREDIICQNLEKLKNLGISYKRLCKWQDKYPFIYAWDVEYDVYRQNVNRKYVVYPLIIAMCECDRDVVKIFKIAMKYKIPFSIRGGSHCISSWSLSDGIIIDQSRRKSIKYKDSEVKLDPGVLLGPMIIALGTHDAVVPCGSCPNVGALGFTLGGGIGFLNRKYGFMCDQVTGLKILLADGKISKVDRDHHPDLFWALCGGGNGNFGIVTEIRLKTHKLKKLWVFQFQYTLDQLPEALKYWQTWEISEDWGTEFKGVNGGGAVEISGVFTGKLSKTREEFRGLVNLNPQNYWIRKMTYPDAARGFAGVGRWPPFTRAKNNFVDQAFPDKAIKIIQKYLGLGTGTSIFELNRVDGKGKTGDTSFAHRSSLFWMLINAHWSNELDHSESEWLTEFHDALTPYVSKGVYVNLPDWEIPKPLEAYYGKNLDRLCEIKRMYDPKNIFTHPQGICP